MKINALSNAALNKAIPDPRVSSRCLYPLFEIIFITLCALIAGADIWKAIENFGKKRRRWLSQFIELKNGIPSHLTSNIYKMYMQRDTVWFKYRGFGKANNKWSHQFLISHRK